LVFVGFPGIRGFLEFAARPPSGAAADSTSMRAIRVVRRSERRRCLFIA
jgi:hypothetical protein